MTTLYHHIEPDNLSNFGVIDNPKLSDDISFIDGSPIVDPLQNPLVFLVNHPVGRAPAHILGDTIPVFSDYLVQTLRAAGVDNFEVFPAVLKNPETGAVWKDYFAVNALGLVAAADMNKSEYDMLMGGDAEGVEVPLAGFHTIVLDKSKVHDLLMFRLAESPNVLLVHDTVMKQIDARRPPDGWGLDATEVDAL